MSKDNCGTTSLTPATYVVWKKWSGSFDADIVAIMCSPSNQNSYRAGASGVV